MLLRSCFLYLGLIQPRVGLQAVQAVEFEV